MLHIAIFRLTSIFAFCIVPNMQNYVAMKPIADIHSQRLWALDGFMRDFRLDFAAHPHAVRHDIATLLDLADAIAAALKQWRRLAASLDVAALAPFDQGHAAALVLECVFDDLLDPSAWRILRAALTLTDNPR